MKQWILIATVILCATIIAHDNIDPPLAVRFIAICAATMIMVMCAKEFKVGIIHIFAVGFLLSVLWSGVFAVNKSEWVYWALRAFLAVTFLSVVEINPKTLAKTMMLLGVVFVGYFWWEFFTWSKVVGSYQFDGLNGLMRQHNYWAAAHFFVIPFCYYAIKERFWRKLAICLMPVMVVHIILLNSRSAMAAIVVTACVMAIYHKKKRWVLAGVVVLATAYFSGVMNFSYDSLHQRFEQWIPTLSMIWENPFGVGAGNWWILFPHYAPNIDFPEAYKQVSFRFPHNDYLWVWAEMGLFGIICYLGMFGVAVWSVIKKKSAWLLMALSGYMTLAFFTACRERPFASLMMMVFIVLACERPDKIKCRKEALIPLTLFLVVLGFHYRASLWNRRLQKVTEFSHKVLMTEGYSPFTTLTYTGMPWHWWRGMANYKLGNKELAYNQFDTAHRYNPYNVHVINAQGIVFASRGDREKALAYFSDALRICPTLSDAIQNLEKIK